MNNSQKVRNVFDILSNDIKEDISPIDLLSFSHWLVEEVSDSTIKTNSLRYGRTPISEQPVYEAIEKMPWRLVNREFIWRDDNAANEPIELLIDNAIDMAS